MVQRAERNLTRNGAGGVGEKAESADGLGVAEALEAIAKLALEDGGSVGIEGDEIPERLGFVLAEIGEGGGVGIGMTGDIFANGAVGMTSEAAQGLGIGAGMLADEAEEVVIGFGGLFGEFLEHFGLGFGAEDEANFFVPGGIDGVEIAGAGVDEFLEDAALLLFASDGKLSAFEGVEDTEEVLTFAEDDLGGAADAAVFLFLVLD